MTGRELLSRLLGHDIYRATNFEILPLNPNISVEHPPHVVESNLLALVRSHFHHGNFILSYTWDITTRLQEHTQRPVENRDKALWELVRWPRVRSLCPLIERRFLQADTRFFWNRFIATRLIDAATSSNETSSVSIPAVYACCLTESYTSHSSGHPTSFQSCTGRLTCGQSSSMAVNCSCA